MDDVTGTGKTLFANKRVRNGIKLFAALAGLLLGLYVVARLAGLLIPITIAIVIAQLLEPLIRALMRRMPIKRGWIATMVALLFFAGLTLLLVWGVSKIVREVGELLRDIPSIAFSITQWLEEFVNRFRENLNQLLPQELQRLLSESLNSFFLSITAAAQNLALLLVNGVTRLPQALLMVIMTIISTVIMCSDRDKIFAFAKRQLPKEWVDTTLGVKDDLIGALLGYIKAQAKIMLCVAIELIIGFSILQNDYALLIALGIALLDALPFFGAGLVLIPLSLANFLIGDFRMGIGVGLMYICTLALRQMLEPRVLGKEIGLHPLLTLTSILLGYRTVGVFGMILGPIVALVCKNTMHVFMGGRTVTEYLDGAPRRRPTPTAQDTEARPRKRGRFSLFTRKPPSKKD